MGRVYSRIGLKFVGKASGRHQKGRVLGLGRDLVLRDVCSAVVYVVQHL